MKWAFVCCAHKRAASPPMRCAKRKVIRRPAALPRVFLLQISLYKKGNSRVASAAGVPNIHLLFSTTVLLPSTAKTGGLIIWFPPISAETTTAEKWQFTFTKIVAFWNPCAFARGFLFSLWECGFFPFAAGICERSERVECAERTTRTLLKKGKCGRGNTYNNSYGVSFLPTHWKWWSRLPSSQHFPL